jgi:hypothetical protein
MKRRNPNPSLLILLLGAAVSPNPLWACAACYGQSDSPLAQGMNWGIFSLLAVIVCVLSCIATFFVFLAKKSASTAAAEKAAAPAPESTQKI